ncbi:MAG TPA: hypothetical protein VIU29_00480 [Candidatus Deferrimicrobiaceae bacterium]
MPVLYHKDDYATLEIDRNGDYVLRVVGVGPGHRDFLVVLEDEEIDRYREWGEHFVVTMAHRIHRDPGQYAERNLLAAVPSPVEASTAAPSGRRLPVWAFGAAAAAFALLAYLVLLFSAVSRPGGEGTLVGGVAVGVHSTPDDVGDLYFMTVRLDDGSTVRVRIAGKADYKENGAVILRETDRPLFGRADYRLERYR